MSFRNPRSAIRALSVACEASRAGRRTSMYPPMLTKFANTALDQTLATKEVPREKMVAHIPPVLFDKVVGKMRDFFTKECGFIEVHPQSRLSILAACEDPKTIATFDYAGKIWPLPQTGQMWLEHEILQNSDVPGYFCVSTSYRNEPSPEYGRHHILFPMFEFELKGGMSDLLSMEVDLLRYLGYPEPASGYKQIEYREAIAEFGVAELENEHEKELCRRYGSAVMLTKFPTFTSPFWNMKNDTDGTAFKCDVLLSGQETIGSAERSCSKEEMRRDFLTISDGGYASILFDKFGEDRVMAELEEFLEYDFIQRSGGGIGITRMIHSMQEELLV